MNHQNYCAEAKKEYVYITLYGDSRRLRRGTVTKTRWLDMMLNHSGSNNTIFNILSDGHRGYSSVVQNVHNSTYSSQTQIAMEGTTAAAFHWDAATYGGLDVNITLAVDCLTSMACHLKPVVSAWLTSIIVFFLWFFEPSGDHDTGFGLKSCILDVFNLILSRSENPDFSQKIFFYLKKSFFLSKNL